MLHNSTLKINRTRNRTKSFGGFSLVEMVIVIGIFAILFSIIISSFFRFRDAGVLNATADDLASLFEDAHNATLASRDDSVYGVNIASTSATLFKGSTYTFGAVTNKVITLSSTVTATSTIPSGNFVFIRLTGATDNTGTTTISLIKDPNQKRVIYVGSMGTIERP